MTEIGVTCVVLVFICMYMGIRVEDVYVFMCICMHACFFQEKLQLEKRINDMQLLEYENTDP